MKYLPYHIPAIMNVGRVLSAAVTLLLLTNPVSASQAQFSANVGSAVFSVTADIAELPEAEKQVEAVPAGPERPPSAQEVLAEVCRARGYGDDCAKILLGMMWKESLGDAKAIGDRGKARGFFQIHYRLHGVAIECAEDLRCSAEWSLTYLERNGYPRHPMYAVQCHNGCNAGNGYAASVRRHGNRLWQAEQPVPVAVIDQR